MAKAISSVFAFLFFIAIGIFLFAEFFSSTYFLVFLLGKFVKFISFRYFIHHYFHTYFWGKLDSS